MAEHVLALIVGFHFFGAAESTITKSRTDLGVGTDHLGDFGIDILEEKIVAGHVHMVLAVVGVVTAFQQLEQFSLASIFRRLTLGNRQIALLDVLLFHGDNHPVDSGNVVVFVVVSQICTGGPNGGTPDKER